VNYRIAAYSPEQADAVVALSLRAWEPVFASIEEALEPEVYRGFYPEGWSVAQSAAVLEACATSDSAWIAITGSQVIGFVTVKLNQEARIGEIYMIAVDPPFQGQGIGRALTEFGLGWMKQAGMAIAMVETGAGAGHESARRTYERSGFRILPIARYFKKL